MKPQIRIIKSNIYPGSMNMALDEAIFELYDKNSPPTLRFYQWVKPTLSLGYFQKSRFFDHVKGFNNIDIVRRPTGGRAVIHHLELTYSVIAGYDPIFINQNLLKSYLIIAKYFEKAFDKLNIKIDIADKKSGENSPNCFVSPSLYEITLNNYKIIGSAQYRNKGKFLQHGAIIFDIDYALWEKVYKRPINKLKNEVKGINHLIKNKLNYEQLQNNIIQAFSTDFNIIIGDFTSGEMEKAQLLNETKYRQSHWTYRR